MDPLRLSAILLERSAVDAATGCRRWTGAHKERGYGLICVLDSVGRRKARSAHSLAHELWVGVIPDGFVVDHVYARGCRHHDCINPAHLEAVTPSENARRHFRRLTHCKAGHALVPENTKPAINGNGYAVRQCRACIRLSRRNREACGPCGVEFGVNNRTRHLRSKRHRETASAQPLPPLPETTT